MKSIQRFVIVSLFFGFTYYGSAQTFTMGKKCRASLEQAQASLSGKNFEEALSLYSTFTDACKTKDAKELGAVGKAEALNGLKRYNEASAEADIALKVTKDRSLKGHFQKAVALNGLGDIEGSKQALENVIALTEKNQNVTERASNYALMSALYERQMNDAVKAQEYLDKAKELDPTNADWIIQEGTMYVSKKDYERAFEAYDAAEALDPNSLDLYIARSNTHLKAMEAKYNTSQAQELRNKMTDEERANVCADLKRAIELGWRDMNKDMFAALVCRE